MKIPGSDGKKDLQASLVAAKLEQQRAKQVGSNQEASPTSGLAAELDRNAGADRTSISSLAAAIKQELNPVAMHNERRDKIEALKLAIRNGTYNPSSLAVAQSLGEEISLGILESGNAFSQAE
ncbi:MAG: flagellar biosynthesis anti-sigma factor FlgM [Pseudomonadota bacterium]|jgi:anti-sigma28 factor (negative regulator of flagellin synthesis)